MVTENQSALLKAISEKAATIAEADLLAPETNAVIDVINELAHRVVKADGDVSDIVLEGIGNLLEELPVAADTEQVVEEGPAEDGGTDPVDEPPAE